MPTVEDIGRDARTGPDWRVATALRIAASQYSDHKLRVALIARDCRTSPRYFGSLFRRHVGVSFHQYLLHLRMRAAVEFLKDSSKTIKEVGSLVGYGETSNFIHDFRRYYGSAPGSWAKRRHGMGI